MKILSVDSSSITASVAITDDKNILSEGFINNGLTHSQTLMPLVNDTLNESKLSINDIDYFAVTNGPGSFTGIRIGISSIKGMADAVSKMCVPVSTLEAIAQPLFDSDVIACSVMDARCNQVYTSSFYKGERLCEDKAMLIDDLGKELLNYNKPIIFIGDGAELCYDKLKGTVKDITVSDENIRYIHASSVGFIANKLIDDKKYVSSDELIPFYLRLPQAERELNNKKLNNKEK